MIAWAAGCRKRFQDRSLVGRNIDLQRFRRIEPEDNRDRFSGFKDLEIHWKLGGCRVHDGSGGLGTRERPWPEPAERKAQDPGRHRTCRRGCQDEEKKRSYNKRAQP